MIIEPPTPAAAAPAAAPDAAALSEPGGTDVAAMVKRKKVSALDAAAQVLRDIGTAMSPKEILAAILDRQIWARRKGKTPELTIGAAMGREIAGGGEASRFLKAGRGKFVANPAVA